MLAQSFSRNGHFVSSSKKILKNRNWTFPIAPYFTWKLVFVSNVLSMIVSGNSVLLLTRPRTPLNFICLTCFGTLRQVSLLNCVLTHLTYHWYLPYAPSHQRVLPIINMCLMRLRNRHVMQVCLDLCCVVTVERHDIFCVCTQINHSPARLFYLFYFTMCSYFPCFFPFFCFKPLVSALFLQLFCNNI